MEVLPRLPTANLIVLMTYCSKLLESLSTCVNERSSHPVGLRCSCLREHGSRKDLEWDIWTNRHRKKYLVILQKDSKHSVRSFTSFDSFPNTLRAIYQSVSLHTHRSMNTDRTLCLSL